MVWLFVALRYPKTTSISEALGGLLALGAGKFGNHIHYYITRSLIRSCLHFLAFIASSMLFPCSSDSNTASSCAFLSAQI